MTTKHWLAAGEVFTDGIGKVTVMAVAGAWAMVRRPRAAPFVIMVRELEQRWQREREGGWAAPIQENKRKQCSDGQPSL